MGSRKNTEQEEGTRSREVFNVMEEVHSRKQYLGKRGGPRICKRGYKRI